MKKIAVFGPKTRTIHSVKAAAKYEETIKTTYGLYHIEAFTSIPKNSV
jgi:hypothetical protein